MTKKRVSGRKNQEARPDFGSAARSENTETSRSAAKSTPYANKTPPPISTQEFESPPKQHSKPAHAPGSASKRKHRKLAVNFDAAKVTDWAAMELCLLLQPILFSAFMVDVF